MSGHDRRLPSLAGRYGDEAQPRVGFFTDTSRLHRLQGVRGRLQGVEPDPARTASSWTGTATTTRGELGANSWRHVAFVEQAEPLSSTSTTARREPTATPLRWLMSSDVCKHCTHAACLDVCPTGSLFRTEFGTVVVQEDVCNGCGYCVPACPFGVLDKRDLPATDDAPLSLPCSAGRRTAASGSARSATTA